MGKSVKEDNVKDPYGNDTIYSYIERQDFVSAVVLDENDNIFIDPDYNRDATLKLDVIIKLNKENIKDIVYSNDEYDYLLEYVVNNYLEDEN